MNDRLPEIADILAAHDLVRSRVVRTPILSGGPLDAPAGIDLWLKAESLQHTGVFKIRGALNAVSKLDADQRGRGVITVSAGNHGIALSYAASQVGSRAVVVMPETAVQAKIDAIKRFGGVPVLVDGATLMPSMEEIRERDGSVFIHPFDNPDVIAGQGTVGLEIVADMPDVEAVVVPVGGGGLISGIATAVKSRSPQTLVIGVEPEGSAAVSASLQSGKPVNLESFSTVADGLNAPWAGPVSFGLIQRWVDEVITISDEEILAAMVSILERTKLLVEPAGAAAVAAILHGHLPQLGGKKVVAVLSGANVDRSKLIACLNQASSEQRQSP